MFHSTGDVVASKEPFIFDFGAAYELDKFEYYPRDNYSNGTVSKMDIYTSLDGVHWNLVHDGAFNTWSYDTSKTVDENVKIVDLTGNAARYVKLVVKNSVGGFFAANELAIYKADGTSAFAVGSTNKIEKVSDGDYTNMKNYRGTCTKDGSNFVDQIQKRYGDINYNNVYDVYDYAFTAFPLDGGTTKRGNVSGNASYDVTVEGENLVIKVMAKSVKNVNAFGQVLNYDPGKLEFVSVTPGNMILDMETDFAVNKLYDDGTAYVNLAYFNKGDKELVKGSGVLATIVMKGTDAEAIDLNSLMLIGPDYSLLTIDTGAGAGTAPVVTYYGQDDVTVTMTNSVLKSDDGSNVTKIIQQKTYDGLFNGTQGRDFEFVWDYEPNWDAEGKLPSYVTLPVTMSIALKEAAPLNQVTVYNANKANGYISKAEAVINYADGTTGDKLVIALEERADYEAFDFVWTANGKAVKSVDVTFLEAVKNDDTVVTNMLTLAEMELKYSETATPTPVEPVEEVLRIAGDGRMDTALDVADVLKSTLKKDKFDTVIIARSKGVKNDKGEDTGVADALAGSYLAVKEEAPILLISDSRMADVVNYVKENLGADGKVFILGGESAVNLAIEGELKDSCADVVRVAGENRRATSIEVAKTFAPDATVAVTATAKNYPDGLCGGPLAAAMNAPLILTRDGDNKAEALEYMGSKGITSGYVLGGDTVLTDEAIKAIYSVEIIKIR